MSTRMGFPPKVLQTYTKFIEALKIHNTIPGGIGTPCTRQCGIPQGCPLSMLMIAILMTPWVQMAKANNTSPKVLADDILLLASGEHCTKHFANMLDKTHIYLIDIGANISTPKSFNFASHQSHRTWLTNTFWPTIKANITTLKSFRYLGAHINTTTKLNNATTKSRLNKALAMLRRLSKLPVTIKHKCNIIRAKIFPTVFYGIEAVDLNDDQLATLTSAILDVLATSKNKTRNLDHTFAANSHGADLDPVGQILVQRTATIRRTLAKHPKLIDTVTKIHHLYSQGNLNGIHHTTRNHTGKPAPHPNRSSRKGFRTGHTPLGPIGLLIQSIAYTGATVDQDFIIRHKHYQDIDFLEMPQQTLKSCMTELYTNTRTLAIAGETYDSDTWNCTEIDHAATNDPVKKLNAEQQIFVKTVMTGRAWNKTMIAIINPNSTAQCQYCGQQNQTTDHIIWECPKYQHIRSQNFPEASNQLFRHFPKEIRRGIAPALSHDPQATFWGDEFHSASGQDQITMGGNTPDTYLDGYDLSMLKYYKDTKMNARHLTTTEKATATYRYTPNFPTIPEDQYPPRQPNAYTDGGLRQPTCHHWSLGGWGLWLPNLDTYKLDEFDTNLTNYMTKTPANEAHFYGPVGGHKVSSTRTEAAALIRAMLIPAPLHVALDNQATVDKFNSLKKAAIKMQASSGYPHLNKTHPLKKPWQLQQDGDIWRLVWLAINQRGPRQTAVSKVKGHATQEDITNGLTTQENARGNAEADKAATQGTQAHERGLTNISRWIESRHKRYKDFMLKVQKTIADTLVQEKKDRNQAHKANTLIHGRGYHRKQDITNTPEYGHQEHTYQVNWKPLPQNTQHIHSKATANLIRT